MQELLGGIWREHAVIVDLEEARTVIFPDWQCEYPDQVRSRDEVVASGNVPGRLVT